MGFFMENAHNFGDSSDIEALGVTGVAVRSPVGSTHLHFWPDRQTAFADVLRIVPPHICTPTGQTYQRC